MSARLVKWHRTHPGAGSTFSKCGRFSIKPAKSGRNYVGFVLRKIGTLSTPGQSQRSWSEDYGDFPTIAKAKTYAERVAKTEAAQRSDRHDFEEAAKREGPYFAKDSAVWYRSPGGVESRVAIVDPKHTPEFIARACNEKAKAGR